MAGIVVSEFLSIDGCFADAAGGLDWVTADEEHHDYSVALLQRTAVLLLGRTTWELFRSYWPAVEHDPDAPKGERAVSALLNRVPKIVFSSTMRAPDWGTTVRRAVVPSEITALREEAAGELVVFGSGSLVQSLQRDGLVTDYHLLVQPVVLGAGRPLFEPGRRLDLLVHRVEQLRSGVVRHYSRPAHGPADRINYSS